MAGTGFFAGPKETLTTMLVNTDAFQTFTGTATPTLARDHVFVYEDSPPDKTAYVLIDDHPETGHFRHVGAGAGIDNYRWTYGTTFLICQHVASFGQTTAEAFDNSVSSIIEDLLAIQRTGDYRPIDELISVPSPEGQFLHQFEIEDSDAGAMIYGYLRIFREHYRQG